METTTKKNIYIYNAACDVTIWTVLFIFSQFFHMQNMEILLPGNDPRPSHAIPQTLAPK